MDLFLSSLGKGPERLPVSRVGQYGWWSRLDHDVFSLQHQQQVAQAVERAKQVTMTELNAIIGVRGLPNLPLTVCIALLFLSFTMTRDEL